MLSSLEKGTVKCKKRERKRYFENAKELLKKSPIEENRYADLKYVQEACGTAYLAVLKALDEYLVKSGVTETFINKLK